MRRGVGPCPWPWPQPFASELFGAEAQSQEASVQGKRVGRREPRRGVAEADDLRIPAGCWLGGHHPQRLERRLGAKPRYEMCPGLVLPHCLSGGPGDGAVESQGDGLQLPHVDGMLRIECACGAGDRLADVGGDRMVVCTATRMAKSSSHFPTSPTVSMASAPLGSRTVPKGRSCSARRCFQVTYMRRASGKEDHCSLCSRRRIHAHPDRGERQRRACRPRTFVLVFDSCPVSKSGPDSERVADSNSYYVNPPNVGASDACIWGDESKPRGNWSPFVAGASQDQTGNTFLKIGWNPKFIETPSLAATLPTFGLKIDCGTSKCVGLPCSIDPSTDGLGGVTSAQQAVGAGGANCKTPASWRCSRDMDVAQRLTGLLSSLCRYCSQRRQGEHCRLRCRRVQLFVRFFRRLGCPRQRCCQSRIICCHTIFITSTHPHTRELELALRFLGHSSRRFRKCSRHSKTQTNRTDVMTRPRLRLLPLRPPPNRRP